MKTGVFKLASVSTDVRERLQTALGKKQFREVKESRVLIVGLGAVGSHVADTLARTGIDLTVVDKDVVESSNLYTSSIYQPKHVQNLRYKANVVSDHLGKFSNIEARTEKFDSDFTDTKDFDLVMDGTDNLETRFEIENWASENNLPWVMSAIDDSKGYSASFLEGGLSQLGIMNSSNFQTCENTGVRREIAIMTAMSSVDKATDILLSRAEKSKFTVLPEGKTLDISLDHNDSDYNIEKSGAECRDSRIRVKTDHGISKIREKISQSRIRIVNDKDSVFEAEHSGEKFKVFKDGRILFDSKDPSVADQILSEAELTAFKHS